MEIKILVAVGDEVLSLTMSQGLWVEHNDEAHWQIDCLINDAMTLARQELDYQRWEAGPWMADEWQEAS